jgi:hypothetical protein
VSQAVSLSGNSRAPGDRQAYYYNLSKKVLDYYFTLEEPGSDLENLIFDFEKLNFQGLTPE